MTQTVLVIEDESELCNILDDELTAQGYKVVLARNGQDGLDKIQEVTPDLIICDRAMPIMSGYQVLERIRGALPQYSSIPFIFLTALSDPRDQHAVDHLKPTAYLEKPVNLNKLTDIVKKSLAK